jgi:hypothetical protein
LGGLKPPQNPLNRRNFFFFQKNLNAFPADFSASNDQKPLETFPWAQGRR